MLERFESSFRKQNDQSSRHTPCAVRKMTTSFSLRHTECAYYYKRRARVPVLQQLFDFFSREAAFHTGAELSYDSRGGVRPEVSRLLPVHAVGDSI